MPGSYQRGSSSIIDGLQLDPPQRFGTSASVGPAEVARALLPRRQTDPNIIPDTFPTTGLEQAGEDGNPGGLARLLDSTVNSPASDPRDRSRSPNARRPVSSGSVASLEVEEVDEAEVTAVEAADAETFLAGVGPNPFDLLNSNAVQETVGADGSVYRFEEGSPTVMWRFQREGGDYSITVPQWIADLCSGRCVCCNKGSLWYMFQGWGVQGVDIILRHRDNRMECNVWAKICGWCRRQVRRDVRELYPELWDEAMQAQDQSSINRFHARARQFEIQRVALGCALYFPDEHWAVHRIWVRQSNRIIDYWQLDPFNYA